MRIALLILPLTYTPPSEEVKQRAAQIERLVQRYFGAEYGQSGQPQFAFLEQFSTVATTPLPPRRDDGLRFILISKCSQKRGCHTPRRRWRCLPTVTFRSGPPDANQSEVNSFLIHPHRLEYSWSPGGKDQMVCKWSGSNTHALISNGQLS